MSAANKLKLMGIQQWRRRADSAAPVTPQVSSESAPTQVLSELRPESAPETQVLRESAIVSEPKISWDSLNCAIADQSGCQHCTAAKPMLGTGDQQAGCVFITSMPSANDMQRQQLLSGRDGQLFDGMLRAMKLAREQVYLTSACKCVVDDDSNSTRPCIQLVHQQLSLIQPKVIVVFGQQAAQWVIKSNEHLPVLRAQAQKCHNTNIPVIVTHDLSQLLAQPSLKAEAWLDLRSALRLLATERTV